MLLTIGMLHINMHAQHTDLSRWNIANLEQNFYAPPAEFRAGSWFFWLSGNISEYGINNSLDALLETGLSKAQMIQVGSFGRTPQGPITVLSDEWYTLLDFYFNNAAKKDIDLVFFPVPSGWSMMGDSTVRPAESTKRLSYSETVVSGKDNGRIKLPAPFSLLDVYQDIAVVAFPEPGNVNFPIPEVVYKESDTDWSPLLDGNWKTGMVLPDINTTMELVYPDPVQVNSLRFWMKTWRERPRAVRVESQDETGKWEQIGMMDTYWSKGPEDVPLVIRLKSTLAKRFRVSFLNGKGTEVNGLELTGHTLVDLFSPKAGYTMRREHGTGADLFRFSASEWTKAENNLGIDPQSIIDLSDNLHPDGSLEWDVPEGTWRILRLGWTTIGHLLEPTPQGVKYYIVDPTSPGAFENYWQGYPSRILGKHSRQHNGAVIAVLTESWEAGNLNWTRDFAKEFKERRGYDLSSYWPILAGAYVVGDVLESDRFLRDFRLTLAEMISENYYGEAARLASGDGTEYWGENTGRQQFLYHPTEYMRHCDVPVGEFWVNDGLPRPDCRSGASMAHFYGRSVVAAESFTSMGAGKLDRMPFDYKRLGDEAFIEGINHFQMHLNTQVPYKGPLPGLVPGHIGSLTVTGNSWWGKPARGWTDYLARCQYMLRQGRNVADILYFSGEDFPAELPGRGSWDPAKEHILKGSMPVEGMPTPPVMNPEIPRGVEFDVCGPEELLNHLSVDADGRLISSGGAIYRFLMLRDWETMGPEIAEKIEELVISGATVIGPPPLRVPGLSDLNEGEEKLAAIRTRLWGTDSTEDLVDRSTGKGRVIWNKSLEDIFVSIDLPFDFSVAGEKDVRYRHRKGEDFDMYFVSNQEEDPFDGELTFRVSGRQPELWDPISGKIHKVQQWQESGALTDVKVSLGPYGSAFVVFREEGKPGSENEILYKKTKEIFPSGDWVVSFPENSGAPEQIILKELKELNTHNEPGVKYFSGTAIYKNSFFIKSKKIASRTHFLDLGVVHGIAEVTVNGRTLANLWCPPYRLKIEAGILKKGKNTIKIALTNSWRNRMIGDEQYPRDFNIVERGQEEYIDIWPDWYVNGTPRPVKERVSFCTTLFYKKDDPLHPSGLIGPVRIEVNGKNK